MRAPKAKVLVADDDRRFLHAVSMRLRKAGYEVILAEDGYQALQFTREHAPGVLVLDINMPAGDGFSVAERLLHIPSSIGTPVIYLSGDKSDRVRHGARKSGAAALHFKPVQFEQLVESIEQALISAQPAN